MAVSQKVGTYTLDNQTVTITAEMGILAIGIQLTSGTVTYQGSLNVGGLTSNALTLADGKPYFVSSNSPIDGFTIISTGVCELTLIK